MGAMAAQVHVEVGEVGSDEARLEELALLLREELLALDVQSVEPSRVRRRGEPRRPGRARRRSVRLAAPGLQRSERLSPWCESGCAVPAAGGR